MKTEKMLAAVMLLAAGSSALAHHGLAAYDTDNLIQLNGKVVGYRLQDPHSLLFVEVENPDGSTTAWTVEGGAGHGIVSAGLTREFLDSNPRVTVTGYRARSGICNPGCLFSGEDFDFER